jgi:hypothetical protein
VLKVAIACIFCLIIGFVGMLALESTLLNVKPKTYNQASLNKPIELGTISLNKKSLVEFSFKGSRQSRNGVFDADLIIKDSDNEVVTKLSVGFWRESGRDSDGAWTESQLSSSPRISLPKGDNYTLSLMPTKMTSWSQINVQGKVTRNVVSTLPIILAVLFLVLMLILLARKRSKFIKKSTGIKG